MAKVYSPANGDSPGFERERRYVAEDEADEKRFRQARMAFWCGVFAGCLLGGVPFAILVLIAH